MDFAVFMEKIGLCPEGVEIFNNLHQRIADPAFCDAVDRGFQAFDAGDEACASFLVEFAAVQNVSVEAANMYLYFRMLARTYEYYQDHIKPKPKVEKDAPKQCVCAVCGYVYEGEEVPDDYICPWCQHGKEDFEPLN